MQILIAYYSRTGITKKLALELAKTSGADVEEIVDSNRRAGVLGYIVSGREALAKKLAVIEAPKLDVSEYDLLIVGTPLWAGTMSSPVRAYLHAVKEKIGKVAFFVTQQGTGQEKVFKILEDYCGRPSVANMSALSKEVMRGDIKEKITDFIKQYEENSTI